MAAAKKTKEGELVMRISKTIQEPTKPGPQSEFDKYEPLVFDTTIRETCPQENYSGRIKELSDLLYTEAAEFLGIELELPEEDQPKTEVEEHPDVEESLNPAEQEGPPEEDIFDDASFDDVPF